MTSVSAAFDFVYPLASININQSAPNLVKMYMTITSLLFSSKLKFHLQIFSVWKRLKFVFWERFKVTVFDLVYTLTSMCVHDAN